MKPTRCILAASILCSAQAFAAQSVIPEPLPADRYTKLVESSPFSVATPVAAPVEDAPNFAANLHVMGIAKLRDAEGKERDYVTIKSHADQTSFTLTTGAANKEGIELAGVEWVDRIGKSKVTVKKGTEVATLEFDQANLHAAAPAVPAPAVPKPGVPGVSVQQQRPGGGMPAPVLPNSGMINGQKPAQRVAPVIPRPNSVPPVVNQPQALPGATNPQAAGQSDTRRRIRVINSKP